MEKQRQDGIAAKQDQHYSQHKQSGEPETALMHIEISIEQKRNEKDSKGSSNCLRNIAVFPSSPDAVNNMAGTSCAPSKARAASAVP